MSADLKSQLRMAAKKHESDSFHSH